MHMGTLLSILVVFRNDIFVIFQTLMKKDTQFYVLALILGTLPAVVVGLGFKDQIEGVFDSVLLVGINLIITGVFLWFTKYLSRGKEKFTVKKGFIVGVVQAFAILPGISRSGSTISMALLLKISQEEAAKFSFLLAIPALAGAGLLGVLDGLNNHGPGVPLLQLTAGFIASFLMGWISLKWLMQLLKQGQFHWFGLYCFIIGIITVIVA